MSEIDIERLRIQAEWHKDSAVLALIERQEILERELDRACRQHEAAASRRMDAEAQRDRLAETLRNLIMDMAGRATTAAQHHPSIDVQRFFTEPDGDIRLPVGVGVLTKAENALDAISTENKTDE